MDLLSSLSEKENLRMASKVEQLQMRDSMRMYNSLVERCFNDCVETFQQKNLDNREIKCVMRCVEKFLKHSLRSSMRHAELTQAAANTKDAANTK